MPTPTNNAVGAVTLSRLAPTITAGRPNEAVIAVTWAMLSASTTASRPTNSFAVAVTLPVFQVSAQGGQSSGLNIAATLQFFIVRTHVRVKGTVFSLTGQVQADGGAIFAFLGPPDRAIEWSLTEGSGVLTADIDYTDSYGRASCRYTAGGYEGPLTVQVSYAG